jgi:hypothetical protein
VVLLKIVLGGHFALNPCMVGRFLIHRLEQN